MKKYLWVVLLFGLASCEDKQANNTKQAAWQPNPGDTYYFAEPDYGALSKKWTDRHCGDDFEVAQQEERYNDGNVFFTKEEAEKMSGKFKLLLRLNQSTMTRRHLQ